MDTGYVWCAACCIVETDGIFFVCTTYTLTYHRHRPSQTSLPYRLYKYYKIIDWIII